MPHSHLLHHHGGSGNTHANYDSDVYAMMTNSVPSRTHVHIMSPYNDQNLRNTPATINDFYAMMMIDRPPSPRMIDDNLVIDSSTIFPYTIHDPQQMIDDINPSIDASTISPATIPDVYAMMMMVDMGRSINDDLHRNGGGTLSEEEISNNMKTRAATEEDATEICTVCQDDLHEEGNNEFIATLHCGHEYHANCIKRWVRQKNVCPLCNAVAIVLPEDM